jgi:hypothetical protein
MTKCTRFLRLTTLLRAGIDPDSISGDRYLELLSEQDSVTRVNLLSDIQGILSGQIVINIDRGEVIIEGRVFNLIEKKKGG